MWKNSWSQKLIPEIDRIFLNLWTCIKRHNLRLNFSLLNFLNELIILEYTLKTQVNYNENNIWFIVFDIKTSWY